MQKEEDIDKLLEEQEKWEKASWLKRQAVDEKEPQESSQEDEWTKPFCVSLAFLDVVPVTNVCVSVCLSESFCVCVCVCGVPRNLITSKQFQMNLM